MAYPESSASDPFPALDSPRSRSTSKSPVARSFGWLPPLGYTFGMKTAVSIPDQVFEEAERLARRLKKSRSEVYSHALAEYLARHGSNHVRELMDRALDEIGEERDDFVTTASRLRLEKSQW